MPRSKTPLRPAHALWLCSALAVSAPAIADWSISAGATSALSGGDVRLACTDLRLDGTLVIGAGGSLTQVRSVSIGPAGKLQLEGGRVELAQQWSVQGNVDFGGGTVRRVDRPDCPAAGPLGPLGPGARAAAVPVPTLGTAALALLALLLAGLAWRRRRVRA